MTLRTDTDTDAETGEEPEQPVCRRVGAAAILDVIERCDGLPLNGRIARSLLVRIVQMLTRLGANMRVRSA